MKALSSMDGLIKAMIGDLSPAGKAWARVGIIVLVVAAVMSFDFGFAISWKHAAFLACLTFVAAFGPDAARKAWIEGKKGSAIAIAVICAPLLAIEFYSHAGYTAGLRGHNLAETKVANVKYDVAHSQVTSEKTNIKMLRDRHAALTADRKALVEANPWAVTVKADGLKSELATLQDRMKAEEAGQRGRRAGRGKEFENLQNQADSLTKRISSAEKLSGIDKEIVILDDDLKGIQNAIDAKVATATKTEYKSSPVAHQNAFLANAVALVANFAGSSDTLNPSEKIAVSTEQSVNLAMALAGTGLPAFALFIAGLYRTKRKDEDDAIPQAHPTTPQAMPGHTSNDRVVHTKEIRTDAHVWADLRRALRPAIAA